jgi:exosome complex component RRP41
MPLAFMPQSNKITLLQFDGNMNKAEFTEALKLGMDGIKKIYQVQQEAIRAKFVDIPGEDTEEDNLGEE